MRSRPTGVVVILVALSVPAYGKTTVATCDVAQLKTTYELFCAETAAETGCKSRTEAGYQWLKLTGYCQGSRTNQPSCQSYAQIKDNCAPLVLAYDHPTGLWNARGALDEKRVAKDVAGKPTASLARREELWVIVERTNPLLFGLTEGAPSEADVPELAQLKKLAGLLGGGIQAVLRTQAMSETQMAADATAQGIDDFLQEYRQAVQRRVEELGRSVGALRCEVDQTTLQLSRLTAFAQAIELDDTNAKYIWSPATCSPNGPAFSRSQLDTILEQLSVLSGQGSCLPALKAARKVVTGDPAPAKRQDLIDAIAEYRAEVTNPACNELGNLALGTLEGRFSALESVIEDDSAVRTILESDDFRGMRRILSAAIELAEREEALLKDTTTLLTQRDTARKGMAQVEVLEKRLHGARLAPRGIELAIADVDRRLILDTPARILHIDKIQSRSIKLAAHGAFATVVPVRSTPVEAGFALDSLARSLWGVSGSVIWTSLSSPTFSAVNDSSMPNKLVIAETDEETRAGKLALLLNYNLGRRLSPTGGWLGRKFGPRGSWFAQAWGIELGAAADTSTPGFFGGFSLRLSKYVRLGGGWTYQQINDLRGQELGQEVKAAGDIKKRDRFELDNYISLSIAIESINLFPVN